MASKKWFVDFLFYISIVALLLAFALIATGIAMKRKMPRRLKLKEEEASNTINSDNSDDTIYIRSSQHGSLVSSRSNDLDKLSMLAKRGGFRPNPNDKDHISMYSSRSSFINSIDNIYVESSVSLNSGNSINKISSTGSLISNSETVKSETISVSKIESNVQSPTVSELIFMGSKTGKDLDSLSVHTETSSTRSRSNSLKKSISPNNHESLQIENDKLNKLHTVNTETSSTHSRSNSLKKSISSNNHESLQIENDKLNKLHTVNTETSSTHSRSNSLKKSISSNNHESLQIENDKLNKLHTVNTETSSTHSRSNSLKKSISSNNHESLQIENDKLNKLHTVNTETTSTHSRSNSLKKSISSNNGESLQIENDKLNKLHTVNTETSSTHSRSNSLKKSISSNNHESLQIENDKLNKLHTVNTETSSTHSRSNSLKKSISSNNGESLQIENDKLNKLKINLNAIKKKEALVDKFLNKDDKTNNDIYLNGKKNRQAQMDLLQISIDKQTVIVTDILSLKKSISSNNHESLQIENDKLNKLKINLNAIKKKEALVDKFINKDDKLNNDIYLNEKKNRKDKMDLLQIIIDKQTVIVTEILRKINIK